MSTLRLFIDSDVVISSVISDQGAAAELLRSDEHELFISNYSVKEIKRVGQRLTLSSKKVSYQLTLPTHIAVSEDLVTVRKQYSTFVHDHYDAHVVAGAVAADAHFLISYNLKHFIVELLKSEFEIITLTPGHFLQYWRSQN